MQHALEDYPGSPFTEELYFLIIDSHFQYAERSTARRKFERYTNAIQAFHTFASRFPESDRMGRAQRLYDASVRAIAELEELGTNTQTNR
jgi:outer membrane protein assembly factor BamD